MRKIVSVLFMALFLAGLVSAPASAAVDAKKYGTGYFTVAPVTLPADGGCFYHPMRLDVNLGYETDGWFVDVTVTNGSGFTVDSWVSDIYYDDWGASYFEETIFICSTIDGPGTYTVSGNVHSVNNGSATVVSQPLTASTFVVSPYVAPVVTPPVVTPTPPAESDVVGKVTKKKVDRGVQFTFKTRALPGGTVVGDKVQWTIVGQKVKSFSQGPSATKKMTLKFPKGSGAHKVKVLRNGKVAMRVTVRA